MPEDADPRTRQIYEDVKETLRVPFVNQIFRLLANNPDCLDEAWQYAGRTARTLAFEDAAKTLRAEAGRFAAPDSSGTDWQSLGDVGRVVRFTATIQYALPKLLLITSLLDPETTSSVGGARPSPMIPRGISKAAQGMSMVDPATAPDRVRAIFDDILERHGHPVVATYFRSLACWPDLLREIWAKLRPLVGEQPFATRRDAVVARAAGLAAELADGPPPELPERHRAMLMAFRRRIIPDLLVEVTIVRTILEGARAAATTPLDIQ